MCIQYFFQFFSSVCFNVVLMAFVFVFVSLTRLLLLFVLVYSSKFKIFGYFCASFKSYYYISNINLASKNKHIYNVDIYRYTQISSTQIHCMKFGTVVMKDFKTFFEIVLGLLIIFFSLCLHKST